MQAVKRTDNTTDATRGQLIGERVLARKAELEEALAALEAGDGAQRVALETALATVEELTTGNIDSPPAAVAQSMNNWLEHNKHLAGGDIAHRTQTLPKIEPPPLQAVEDTTDAPTGAPGAELVSDEETTLDAEKPVDVDSLNDGDATGPDTSARN